MFQFAGFASCSYGFTTGYGRSRGFPHSEIPGSTGARPLPGLIAACHVLHRLSVPRHSPNALLIKLHHIQPQTRAACCGTLPDSCMPSSNPKHVLAVSRSTSRTRTTNKHCRELDVSVSYWRGCESAPALCIPMFVGHKRWFLPRQTLPKTYGRSSSRARVTVTIHFTMSMDTSGLTRSIKPLA